MRNDLLYAHASVNWASNQLADYQSRLTEWVVENVRLEIEELPNSETNALVAKENELLPLFFSVEAGAYINSIRSALDMVAVALAERCNFPNLDKVYFPVAKNLDTYFSPHFSGYKFLDALPVSERKVIDALKPYGGEGGNAVLHTLHRLDIFRKHHRLLTTNVIPNDLKLYSATATKDFIPIGGEGYVKDVGKTIIALVNKGVPMPDYSFRCEICIDEVGFVNAKPVTYVLDKFAKLAFEIIDLFDE